MASITSIGIGSGLDIESMISQLVAVERAPVTKLQAQASSLQTQLSTYGKLQSGMAALRDAGVILPAAAVIERAAIAVASLRPVHVVVADKLDPERQPVARQHGGKPGRADT